MWPQTYDPAGHAALSTLAAAVPIVVLQRITAEQLGLSPTLMRTARAASWAR